MLIVDYNEEYDTPWITLAVIASYFIWLVAAYLLKDRLSLLSSDHNSFLQTSYLIFHSDVTTFVINAYLLWVFGDNVEYILGHVRYTLFLIISAFATGFLYMSLSPMPESIAGPGIYGAVGCVVGVYARIFPNVCIDIFYYGFRSHFWLFTNEWWDIFELKAKWVAFWWILIGVCCLFFYELPNAMVKIVSLQAAGIAIGWLIGSFWRDDTVILRDEMDISFKRDHWVHLKAARLSARQEKTQDQDWRG